MPREQYDEHATRWRPTESTKSGKLRSPGKLGWDCVVNIFFSCTVLRPVFGWLFMGCLVSVLRTGSSVVVAVVAGLISGGVRLGVFDVESEDLRGFWTAVVLPFL